MANDLRSLPNIGNVAASALEAAGIATAEDLRRVGSREAFLRIRAAVDPTVCVSMLQGLEGAVQGVRWHSLDPEVKKELTAFYRTL